MLSLKKLLFFSIAVSFIVLTAGQDCIFDEREATKGQFGHYVWFFAGGIYCAGSLISDSWVISSGHCINS